MRRLHHRGGTAAIIAASAICLLTAFPAGSAAASTRHLQAVPLPLPVNAGKQSTSILFAMDCGSGFCTAGGSYTDRRGHANPMVAAESHGRWQRAI